MQRHFDLLETMVDIGAVLRYVRDHAIKAGVVRMSYHVVPQFENPTSATTAVYAHGFSDEWLSLYDEAGFRDTDPIPARVMDYGSLMTWADAMIWQPNTPEQAAYIARMQEYGLVHGFGLPLYGRNGRDGYASFDFERHVDEVPAQDVGLVRSLAQAGHQRISILVEWEGKRLQLSERETEVLNWVARGKSVNSIATILSLSPDTVKTYSKRIYAKLDVTDRVGAVIKALRLGLVKV